MIEKKDVEIGQLSNELVQKSDIIELQTQTLNKILADSNNAPTPVRTLNNLSNQKLNDNFPGLRLSQSSKNNTGTTPSPMRSYRASKDINIDNSQLFPSKIKKRMQGAR